MYFASKHIYIYLYIFINICIWNQRFLRKDVHSVFLFDLMMGGAEDSLLSNVLTVANKELIEIARSDAFVLRQRFYDGLSSEDWMSAVSKEMATRCPVVNEVISSLLECNIYLDRKKPSVCLIYALSRIQRINSVLLIQGQASANVSN